ATTNGLLSHALPDARSTLIPFISTALIRGWGYGGLNMRLIIVSNRLPITIAEQDGHYEVTRSAGGVATGLDAFVGSDHAPGDSLWVGWPGAALEADKQEEVRRLCRERGAHPVFISEADQELYYEGFCNNTVWPLFHYFPLYASYDQEAWEAYVRVNQAFAD